MKFSGQLDENRAFDSHFGSVYGSRWPALRTALLSEPRRSTLRNPFGAPYQDYILDEASLAPVRALDLRPGLRMADLCASPGGKALASVFESRGEGEWVLCDLSPARVARLKAVMHDCLPVEVLGRVRFERGDSSRFGLRHAGAFDRALVDAPCSGERHLVGSARELARWSLKGSKRLAVRQHALLCAGFDSLVSGGRLVYSTCSISPVENEGVVERLHESREGLFRVVECAGAGEGQSVVQVEAQAQGEPTRFGRIILPDVYGCGPIYYCVIEKI